MATEQMRSMVGPDRRADFLGWFSIGLGLAEILAPRGLAELIGAPYDDRKRATMWGLGLREITAGVGILTRPQPAGWVWARVAGDLMDLAFLGAAMRSPRANRQRLFGATAAVVGCTVLDALTAQQLTHAQRDERRSRTIDTDRTMARSLDRGSIRVRQAITVQCSPAEAYDFWHAFENLPRFMAHLESVRVEGTRSHWVAKAPAGMSVEWDAEIIEDVPNERIAWRSMAGSEIPNAGFVRFVAAPGNRGTEIHVELRYDPPGGRVGALFAKLFGEEPTQQIKSDLRRFKQVIEVGEVVHSDASIHRGMHPAQPSAVQARAKTKTNTKMPTQSRRSHESELLGR